jgi:hypothetical protein
VRNYDVQSGAALHTVRRAISVRRQRLEVLQYPDMRPRAGLYAVRGAIHVCCRRLKVMQYSGMSSRNVLCGRRWQVRMSLNRSLASRLGLRWHNTVHQLPRR